MEERITAKSIQENIERLVREYKIPYKELMKLTEDLIVIIEESKKWNG